MGSTSLYSGLTHTIQVATGKLTFSTRSPTTWVKVSQTLVLRLLAAFWMVISLTLSISMFRNSPIMMFTGTTCWSTCPFDLVIYRNQPIYSQVQVPTSHHPDRLQKQHNYLSIVSDIVYGLGDWSWRHPQKEGACLQNWQWGGVIYHDDQVVWQLPSKDISDKEDQADGRSRRVYAWPTTIFWVRVTDRILLGMTIIVILYIHLNGLKVHMQCKSFSLFQRSKYYPTNKCVTLQVLNFHGLYAAKSSVTPEFWTGHSHWTSTFFLVSYAQDF